MNAKAEAYSQDGVPSGTTHITWGRHATVEQISEPLYIAI